jgi:microcin C transport system permease protein
MRISPLTQKKIRRFVSIRRGFWSFVILMVMILVSVCTEVFINSRALVVSFQGKLYFPVFASMLPGRHFGLDYDYETNYRRLKARFQAMDSGDWVLMPPVPYNPYENDLRLNDYPPFPPSFRDRHFLGTDNVGRDILARLVYGSRTTMGAWWISASVVTALVVTLMTVTFTGEGIREALDPKLHTVYE